MFQLLWWKVLRTSKKDIPTTMESKDFIIREAVWGDMHVEYGTFNVDFDVTPFLKGLPNDRDPTPHWGYVMKGLIRSKVKGREEVFNAGDVYYMEPGHTAIVEKGSEYVEFSPNKEYMKTMEVVAKNLEKLQKK